MFLYCFKMNHSTIAHYLYYIPYFGSDRIEVENKKREIHKEVFEEVMKTKKEESPYDSDPIQDYIKKYQLSQSVAVELNQILTLIMRDYIQSWYQEKIGGESAFPLTIKNILLNTTGSITKKIAQKPIIIGLIADFFNCLSESLYYYKTATKELRNKQPELFQESNDLLINKHHQKKIFEKFSHTSAFHDSMLDNELQIEFLRTLSRNIVRELIPSTESMSICTLTFFTEILTHSIFANILESITPDTINQFITVIYTEQTLHEWVTNKEKDIDKQYVPKNSVTNDIALQYFKPYLSREQAEIILKSMEFGCFLLRGNSPEPSTFFLSYTSLMDQYKYQSNQQNKPVYHSKIEKGSSMYFGEDVKPANCLIDIIKKYRHHVIRGVRIYEDMTRTAEMMQWGLEEQNNNHYIPDSMDTFSDCDDTTYVDNEDISLLSMDNNIIYSDPSIHNYEFMKDNKYNTLSQTNNIDIDNDNNSNIANNNNNIVNNNNNDNNLPLSNVTLSSIISTSENEEIPQNLNNNSKQSISNKKVQNRDLSSRNKGKSALSVAIISNNINNENIQSSMNSNNMTNNNKNNMNNNNNNNNISPYPSSLPIPIQSYNHNTLLSLNTDMSLSSLSTNNTISIPTNISNEHIYTSYPSTLTSQSQSIPYSINTLSSSLTSPHQESSLTPLTLPTPSSPSITYGNPSVSPPNIRLSTPVAINTPVSKPKMMSQNINKNLNNNNKDNNKSIFMNNELFTLNNNNNVITSSSLSHSTNLSKIPEEISPILKPSITTGNMLLSSFTDSNNILTEMISPLSLQNNDNKANNSVFSSLDDDTLEEVNKKRQELLDQMNEGIILCINTFLKDTKKPIVPTDSCVVTLLNGLERLLRYGLIQDVQFAVLFHSFGMKSLPSSDFLKNTSYNENQKNLILLIFTSSLNTFLYGLHCSTSFYRPHALLTDKQYYDKLISVLSGLNGVKFADLQINSKYLSKLNLKNNEQTSTTTPVYVPKTVSKTQKSVYIRVTNYRISESRDSKFVEYCLSVRIEQKQWEIYRRFSKLHHFHSQLVSKITGIYIPPFPPKTFTLFNTFSNKFINDRITELNGYFERLCANDQIINHKSFDSILYANLSNECFHQASIYTESSKERSRENSVITSLMTDMSRGSMDSINNRGDERDSKGLLTPLSTYSEGILNNNDDDQLIQKDFDLLSNAIYAYYNELYDIQKGNWINKQFYNFGKTVLQITGRGSFLSFAQYITKVYINDSLYTFLLGVLRTELWPNYKRKEIRTERTTQEMKDTKQLAYTLFLKNPDLLSIDKHTFMMSETTSSQSIAIMFEMLQNPYIVQNITMNFIDCAVKRLFPNCTTFK
ncbi:hypothetical protein WA158_005630 [Blastocystis sp. Blastoise]